MFYRLEKKKEKTLRGWGVGATTNQNWFSKKKKKPALEQRYKLQGYLLLIKSNNACKTKSNNVTKL